METEALIHVPLTSHNVVCQEKEAAVPILTVGNVQGDYTALAVMGGFITACVEKA